MAGTTGGRRWREDGALPRALRASTRRALVPTGPPTDEIPVWTSPDGVPSDRARAVIDLAMRAGVALLATGAGAADVVNTVLLLTKAYGLRSVHVDVTYTSVGVSYHRGPHADPMTVIRVVKFRNQDFTRLERLRDLVEDLGREAVPVEQARERFEEVVGAPHPYRRWVVTAASALVAAAVAVLIGAGPLVTTVTAGCAVLIDRVQHLLGSKGVSAFFGNVVGAAIPTLAATLLVTAGSLGWEPAQRARPSLVVAAAIVLLLAGLSVVGAAGDALEGYYVTAGARSFEVVALTLGIVVGVTIVLSLGTRAGYYVPVPAETHLRTNVVVQLVCAALIAAAFAVSAYATGLTVVLSGVAGFVSWGAYVLVTQADIGPATASATAGAVVGFLARAFSRRMRVSALAVTTAAIISLLPGRAVYQGISEIVSNPTGSGLIRGLPTLAGAAGIGLGLAAGVSLGTYLAGLVSAMRRGVALRPATGARLPWTARDRSTDGAPTATSPGTHAGSATGEIKAIPPREGPGDGASEQ